MMIWQSCWGNVRNDIWNIWDMIYEIYEALYIKYMRHDIQDIWGMIYEIYEKWYMIYKRNDEWNIWKMIYESGEGQLGSDTC